MPGASGSQGETAPKTLLRREVERLPMYNHHREELQDARARWREALERRFERPPGELDFPLPSD